jgi:hypothetical protein
MKRASIAVVFALVGLVLLAPGATAGGAGSNPEPARERWHQFWAERQVQMVRRGLHPGAALPLPKAAVAPAAPTAWTRVRGVQQISQDNTTPRDGSEPDTQAEPYIAMDPNNPLHVVAVFQQGRFPDGGSVGPGYATTQDGGRTWVTDEFPGVTTDRGGFWDRASDPWVAFGPDGTVYAVLIAFQEVACDSGITVSRSDDGGITWNAPVEAQHDTSCAVFNDKESITVDTDPNSPHKGRVYITWDRLSVGQPIQLKYSDDRGQTWSSLKSVSGSVSGVGANVLAQPNGSVSVVYIDLSNGFEVAQTSTNGGDTWGPIVDIGLDEASSPFDQRVNCDLPTFAVDPVTSFMYVGWCDTRFRSDGLNDILVWKSTNGGSTWTGPVKVNADSSGSGLGHLNVGLAANNHVVHAFYLVRKNNGGVWSNFVVQRYSHSEDDGVTYTSEIPVGPKTDLTFAAEAGGKFLGDYIGIAASATMAHPVWCRASQPAQQQTYHQTTWSAVVFRGTG